MPLDDEILYICKWFFIFDRVIFVRPFFFHSECLTFDFRAQDLMRLGLLLVSILTIYNVFSMDLSVISLRVLLILEGFVGEKP